MVFGFKKRRRERIKAQTIPAEHLAIIEQNVPYYQFLSPEDQSVLRGLVQVFLAEKQFEGCGGLVINDEIRVTIAAHACILLLGSEGGFYSKLRSILVYPRAYVSNMSRHRPDGTVVEGAQTRLGESWDQGYVVLSWDDVMKSAQDMYDGRNVVLHEFAHQLDSESGSAEGAPILHLRSMYVAWARVLGREFEALTESVERNKPSILDRYGAISPAEFFAVATEHFFERPGELKAQHPELYEQLHLFYRQDPASLFEIPAERNRKKV